MRGRPKPAYELMRRKTKSKKINWAVKCTTINGLISGCFETVQMTACKSASCKHSVAEWPTS